MGNVVKFEKKVFMRKIIFLTLVMILGMSSVSFGKEYLCISEVGRLVTYTDEWSVHEIMLNKFIVKTERNDERMESVKFFDKDYYLCRDGTDVMDKNYKGKIDYEKGESIKGNTFLSCRLTFLKSSGSHVHTEFILDLEKMLFDFYTNFSRSERSIRMTQIYKGKCSEI